MISYETFKKDSMKFIREHGFNRFFIYSIKRCFIYEYEIPKFVEDLITELANKEQFEDCALLQKSLNEYIESGVKFNIK